MMCAWRVHGRSPFAGIDPVKEMACVRKEEPIVAEDANCREHIVEQMPRYDVIALFKPFGSGK
jgi:hypothetical protein